MPRNQTTPQRWFDIVANAEEKPKVYLYGNIGGWDIDASMFVEALKPHAGKDLDLHFLSSGGSVFEGQAIYSALSDHDGEITAIIDSVAASIASFILMACDKIFIRPHAQIMIHECRGGFRGTADEMRTMAAMYDEINDSMAEAISAKSGKKVEDVRNDMKTDFWMRGQAAIDYGIADGFYQKESTKASALSAQNPTQEELAAVTTPSAELLQSYDAPLELVAMYGTPAAQTDPITPVKPANNTPAAPVAQKGNTMTDEEKAAFKQDITASVTVAVMQGETQRRESINAAFKGHEHNAGVSEILAQCLNDMTVTAEQAKDRLLAALCRGKTDQPNDPNANANANTQHSPAPVVQGASDPNAQHLSQLEAAIHHKMGAESVDMGENNPYRFLPATASLRAYFSATGDVNAAGMKDTDLVAFAFNNGSGSSDLAPIFERGIKRIIRDNESKFKPWIQKVVTRQAMDIGKANLLLKTQDVKSPRVKNEHGEFTQIKLGADKEVVWLGTSGYEIQVSRELIMADDLGFIGTEVAKYVRRCSMVPQITLIEMLKKNANLGDDKPIFADEFDNLVESSEFTPEAIDKMSSNMKDMTTSQGEDLGLTPQVLLTSGGTQSKAKACIKAETIANVPNVAHEAFDEVIGTGQLAKANKAFGVADPMSITGIVEGYNAQAQGVQMETKETWKSDGATFRIYIDSVIQVRDRRALQCWSKKAA